MKLKTVFVFCIVFAVCNLQAQKKKQIKKYNITRVVTSKTNSSGNKIREELKCYNSLGQLTLEVQYNKEGVQQSCIHYFYTINNELSEERVYTRAGHLIERRIYTYNPLKQKTGEQVLDGRSKQIKRITYTYNTKGLKTEKRVYDSLDKSVGIKLYEYTYN
jgi:hypothetical protein